MSYKSPKTLAAALAAHAYKCVRLTKVADKYGSELRCKLADPSGAGDQILLATYSTALDQRTDAAEHAYATAGVDEVLGPNWTIYCDYVDLCDLSVTTAVGGHVITQARTSD